MFVVAWEFGSVLDRIECDLGTLKHHYQVKTHAMWCITFEIDVSAHVVHESLALTNNNSGHERFCRGCVRKLFDSEGSGLV